MAKKKIKGKRIIKGWAGIVEDNLDHGQAEQDGFKDKCYGIFVTRKAASKKYEKVVSCIISYSLISKQYKKK